ncbi:MAG: hypothetical protein HFJ19_05060 [Clostridia bacterium]|nr:hypothetical protein [Clostridia bacterium]
MRKVFIYLIVIIIVYLSFFMPNILFSLEDLNMENTSYKKKPIDNKIDVQAENIYLVKAIHDMQDGTSNLKIADSSSEIMALANNQGIEDETIKKLIEEINKMKEYNILEGTFENYEEMKLRYHIYGREYSNLENKYLINRIVFSTDEYEKFVEIEEKTGKIIYYVGTHKEDVTEEIGAEEVLRNYIRYLDLYIIDDWTFRDNMLISEKAKLMANFVNIGNQYLVAINSISNEHILDIYKYMKVDIK